MYSRKQLANIALAPALICLKLRSPFLSLSHFDQVDPVKERNCLYRETLIRLDVTCERAH